MRETYGALLGGYQGQHAFDGALRAAMVRIAEDEARHAGLAHDVHRWILPLLSPPARARVQHAQERAVFALISEVMVAPDPTLQRLAGLPTPETARILLEGLRKVLWRPSRRISAA